MRGATTHRAEQKYCFEVYRKELETCIEVLGDAVLELTFTVQCDKEKSDSALMKIRDLPRVKQEMKHMVNRLIAEKSLTTTWCMIVKPSLVTMMSDQQADFMNKLLAESDLEAERKHKYDDDMAHYKHQIDQDATHAMSDRSSFKRKALDESD